MAQYRAIHTKITQSFDFNEMPDDFTRLMWVLMPLGLDREGRGINNTSWLRSKLFPLREDVTANKISQAFDWMVDRRMVVLYEVDGRQYFWVPTFLNYQRVDREAASSLPAPSEESVKTNSVPTPDQLQTDSCLNDIKGNDIKEKEIVVKTSASTVNFSESRPILETNYVYVWITITGMSGIPASQSQKVIDAIDTLRPKFKDEKELIDYLKPYYDYWLTRKTKDGRTYSKSNCAWLYDLAIAGDPIPQPKAAPVVPAVMFRQPLADCGKCHGEGWYKGEIGGKTRRVECDWVKVQEEVNA